MEAQEKLPDLPQGWAYAKIGEICSLVNGRAFKAEDWSSCGLPIIRIQNLNNHDAEFNYCSFDVEDKYYVDDGQLLFAWSGTPGTSFGAHIWSRGKGILNQHIFKVNINEQYLNKKFIMNTMNYNVDLYIKKAHGTAGLAHITKGKFEESLISLPPLPEQHRIVSRIDELFSRLDAGVEALRMARAQLHCYRQSVLQAAVEGRLTAEWRAAHPEVENVGWLSNHDDTSKLPKNWINTNLKGICIDVTDGDHQPPPQSSEGIPFLFISNIRSGKLDFEKTRFVHQEYYDSIPEIRKPSKGDILYSLVGSYGIPVIVDTDRKFCFQRHIGLIRPQKSVDVKYLSYFLKSDLAYKQATEAATGTAQMTVSLKGLRNFRVPFPPLMEQHEIASQIERVFLVSDQLEATIESNLIYIDRLRQSILRRAFEGHLVPQDPNDEPASLLLDRIRAERIKEPPRRGRKSKAQQSRLAQ